MPQYFGGIKSCSEDKYLLQVRRSEKHLKDKTVWQSFLLPELSASSLSVPCCAPCSQQPWQGSRGKPSLSCPCFPALCERCAGAGRWLKEAGKSSAVFPLGSRCHGRCNSLHPTSELGVLVLYFAGSLPLLCKDLPWVAALRDS